MSRPLLFVGDIHLGRSPHRLEAAGLDPSQLDPAEAWRRVVRYAVCNDVQAVVLAGDVVDQDKDRFEAWAHLKRGVSELVAAGVRVLGVAGNHDHIALPRLATRIEDFTLLGRGGIWERVELDGVDLVGWSFPARHHSGNPLFSLGLDEALANCRPEALTIGVFHGHLDAGDSSYAPVRRVDLAARSVAAWFLGHIHIPDDLCSERPIGYLGSLVGLDRGETGSRGPWLITPTSASRLTARHLPLGPVYWTDIDVDVSELRLDADASDTLHSALESRIAQVAQGIDWLDAGDFSAVGCSVRFTGRSDERSRIHAFIDDRQCSELVFESRGMRWAVVHMSDHTRPARDLPALAAERTPLGQLAQLVVAIDTDGLDALPDSIRSVFERFDPLPWAADLERDPLPDQLAVTRSAALQLLDHLLLQRDKREVS